MTTTELSIPGEQITLRDGTVVQLPFGSFPAPSAEVIAMFAIRPRRAALSYSREASIPDADGVTMRLCCFTADRWLTAGNFTSGPEITGATADVDSYLRARAVFAHPERFAPEHGNGTCDRCGKYGPGMIILAPDAMCSPSEVDFISDCCGKV